MGHLDKMSGLTIEIYDGDAMGSLETARKAVDSNFAIESLFIYPAINLSSDSSPLRNLKTVIYHMSLLNR